MNLPFGIVGNEVVERSTGDARSLPPPGVGFKVLLDALSGKCYLADKGGNVMWIHKLFRQKPSQTQPKEAKKQALMPGQESESL